jgi:hypothetical protein
MPFAVHTRGRGGGASSFVRWDGNDKDTLTIFVCVKLHEGSHCLRQTRQKTCFTAASVSVDVRSAYPQNGSQKHYYLSPLQGLNFTLYMLRYGRGAQNPGGSSEWSCHPSSAWNFEVDPRILENFCIPMLRPSSHLHPAGEKPQGVDGKNKLSN